MTSNLYDAGLPWELLSPLLTEDRRNKLLKSASERTDKVSLVLQNINDPHNASACLRSAEAFGLIDIHIIDPDHQFRRTSVAKGSQKWLELRRWSSTKLWLESAKRQKIFLAGACADAKLELDDIPLDRPVALIFGNEHHGLDAEMKGAVDAQFSIPMAGLVESLNISVAAAVSMYVTTKRASQKWKQDYYLSPERLQALLDQWIFLNVREPEKTMEKMRDRLS